MSVRVRTSWSLVLCVLTNEGLELHLSVAIRIQSNITLVKEHIGQSAMNSWQGLQFQAKILFY